jgi:hemoglobin
MSTEETQEVTAYDLIGGERRLRALVDRFYDLMDLEPEFADLRAMHPSTLEGSRDKLFWFLSGWTGGPPVYAEKIGHPMLRARHLPFTIRSHDRDQWLRCMATALRDEGYPEDLQERLLNAFFKTADWMRNTHD